MISQFCEVLLDELEREITNYTSDLAAGQPATYDEFKRLVGLIQGLRLAQQHINDLADRAENDDDD